MNAGFLHRIGGRRYLLALAAGPLAAALTWGMARSPGLVEAVYGERVARWSGMVLGWVTGWVPWSVAELGILAAPVALVGFAAWRGPRAIVRQLPVYLAGVLALASVGYAIFLLSWGAAAHRRPLGETLHYPVQPSSPEELTALYVELLGRTNELREAVPKQDGIATTLDDASGVLARAVGVYRGAGEGWALLAGRYAPPKPVLLSRWMSATGILGIYIPFTGEANVDIDAPLFALPFVACHEMAHQRGFTREDEANFVAWLVAGGPDAPPDFRYSASLNAQIYVAGALARSDYEAWVEHHAEVSPGVLADVAAWGEWSTSRRSRAADVAAVVNEGYLRSQGASGLQSYGEVVDLLLAERRGRVGPEGSPKAP